MLGWILFSIFLLPYFAAAIVILFVSTEKISNVFYRPFLKTQRNIITVLETKGFKNKKILIPFSKFLTIILFFGVVLFVSIICFLMI